MNSSSSDYEETREKRQIEHFLHDHPLIFFENIEKLHDCEICNGLMFYDPGYGCIPCFFYVHKSCGEIPKQVRNMFHPQHLLEFSKSEHDVCDACGNYCTRSYLCKLCDFELDVECVLEGTFEEPRGHKEHTFKTSKPALFTCDACGIVEVKKHISRVCTTCHLQVHNQCANSYSFTIKEPRHSHLLKLTYSFQMDTDFTDKICKICFRKMNDVLFMYSCADCAYITHVKCGNSTNTLHDDDDGEMPEIENEVFNTDALESKGTRKQQIEHFSHSHSLILNISGPNSIILCDGCVMPIFESFYSCDQCNFFLHQNCIELKEKIQHPLHAHKLTLSSTWDKPKQIPHLYPRGWSPSPTIGNYCYGCGLLCNGFMYRCESCIFYLDLGCSSLPDILIHEGHKCALTLIDMYESRKPDDPDYKTKCSACGFICINKFICEGCNFNLDLKCASLPKTIPHECPKHDWNMHPFELTYYSIEDGCGKFYCDVCEEERNENHWFYYCQNCDYSAHPSCILGHDRIKYGSLHKIKDHPHCVRFLKTAKGNHTCKACLKPCEKEQTVFACEECDDHFHFFCASLVLTNEDPCLF